MAKLQFSASKDPLLTGHSARQREEITALQQALDAPAAETAAPEGAEAPAAGGDAPVGSAATPAARSGARRAPAKRRPRAQPSPSPEPPRAASSSRRVQTSMSLVPQAWAPLDDLARAAGCPAGQLLVVLLDRQLPADVAAALELVERQLLGGAPPAVGEPNEDRNYRLPLDLRRSLDRLADELGAEVTRSMLIGAILAEAMPSSAEDARVLLRERVVASMRAAVAAPPMS